MRTLYIEESIRHHPRTREICRRFPRATRILCERYGEVFNRKAQNFRLQKKRPALILARKAGACVLKAPPEYNIGGGRNFYFSHMLNCLYDCRYCFLQGMYRSAHYVVFVNHEDFQSAIAEEAQRGATQTSYFFSGYDCDSLALDPVTGFVESFVPFFAGLPNSVLELRTKSTCIRSLLRRPPVANCVVAFSLSPDPVARAYESQVPALERRLAAMEELQAAGWRLGLRFDPLLYWDDYQAQYRRLFRRVFDRIRVESLHSVSLGAFRLPRDFYRTMVRQNPRQPLLAGPLEELRGTVAYRRDLEAELVEHCTREVLNHVPRSLFFPCPTPVASGVRAGDGAQ